MTRRLALILACAFAAPSNTIYSTPEAPTPHSGKATQKGKKKKRLHPAVIAAIAAGSSLLAIAALQAAYSTYYMWPHMKNYRRRLQDDSLLYPNTSIACDVHIIRTGDLMLGLMKDYHEKKKAPYNYNRGHKSLDDDQTERLETIEGLACGREIETTCSSRWVITSWGVRKDLAKHLNTILTPSVMAQVPEENQKRIRQHIEGLTMGKGSDVLLVDNSIIVPTNFEDLKFVGYSDSGEKTLVHYNPRRHDSSNYTLPPGAYTLMRLAALFTAAKREH